MKRISLIVLAIIMASSIAAMAKPTAVLGPGLGSGRTAFHQTYNLALSADTTYYLTGLYYVDSTKTLTIPAGTVVKGDTAATLIIKRGARILANGTAERPIVFTSMKPAGQRARGDWGGVIILGEAPVNQVNPLIEGGIIEGTYGGINPNDNSGIFKYVRIEYPGYRYQLNNEVNGLTMGGVGDGTEIHHIQVSYSFDDSYEWFGGTVNCRCLIAFGGTDDEFDTDFGYSGRVQFGFGLKDPAVWDPTGETNGFESDNEGTSPYQASPKTHPIFCNVTLVGPERTDALVGRLPVGHKFQYGAVIRRATEHCIFNSCVMGYPWGYSLRDDSTKKWANLDMLRTRNTNFQASAIPVSSTHVHDENRWKVSDPITPGILAWFNMLGYSNQDSPTVPGAVSNPSYIQLVDMSDLNDPDPRPQMTSPLVTNGTDFTYAELMDPFFTPVTYRGAFDPSLAMNQQWTAGWSEFDPQGWDEQPPEICGVVLGPGLGSGRTAFHRMQDRVLSPDSLYFLTGIYYVDSTKTFTIPAGTVVRGDTASTLVITRGAKIYATGTPQNPVVFTSMKPAGQRARGDWGGVIILGQAPVNQVNPLIEGGIIGGTYGGTDPNDNSGIFRYVRIEYPGYRYQLNNEVNGLTMGGVGAGTEIHHVQVSYSFDDSYEWFGGTVNCRYLVAFGGTDDEFDCDFGYAGRVQFGFGLKDAAVWDPTGETNGFEWDNEGTSPYQSVPKTHPAFSNITLVGPERVDALVGTLPIGHKFQYGAVLRRATIGGIFNSCVMGYPWGFSIRDDSTKKWANIDTLKVKYNSLQASVMPVGSTHIHDEVRWPVADPITPGVLAWINVLGYGNQDSPGLPGAPSMPSYIQLTNMTNLNNPDPRPLLTSPLVTLGTNFTYPELTDPFFAVVTYRGAFDPNLQMNQQWTADWTNFNPQGEAYYASVDEKDPAKNAGVQLSKAQPNPFSGVATIRYTVPQTGPVSLKVFNVQGQLVATLVDGVRQAGVYEAELKVESKASGVYLYRYFGKGFDETHKMVLTR